MTKEEKKIMEQYIDKNAYSKFQSEKSSESGDNEDLNILQRFSFYSYKDEPNILYLAGLYVNDEHRNKGIGTKILKIANEVAISIGCNIIRLKTQKDTDAERFYRKNGYNTLTEEGNQVWLEKQSTLQVRTGLEWINTVDDACDKRYSEEYAHGEYCHEQSFKWGFQEGVEWLEEQGGQKSQSSRESAKRVDPKFKVGDTIYFNSFGEVKSIIVANVIANDNTGNPMYEDEDGNYVFEKDLIEYNPTDDKIVKEDAETDQIEDTLI